MIELILPWPPTVNHYKKVGRLTRTVTGKTYQARVNTTETKTFYYEVWVKIKSLINFKRNFKPIHSTISMHAYLHPPDKRKRDIDNVIKPLLDSLVKGGLLQDDSQITRLVIERCDIIPPRGQVVVRIEELT